MLLFFFAQFSDYFTGYFNGQYWLWWIFLLLGEYFPIIFVQFLPSGDLRCEVNAVLPPAQACCCSSGVS